MERNLRQTYLSTIGLAVGLPLGSIVGPLVGRCVGFLLGLSVFCVEDGSEVEGLVGFAEGFAEGL